ncbi:MAG: patatin-like phospholipase family protein, partial [Rhodobacteraceae bacterium]|nr:patatin-like phospholipase family protein [Paracoccaceae bacterium]
STQQPELIRRGEMWRAVRASSAIPGLLPPVYTPDGMLLVDGGLMDNLPLGPMRDVKTGPNLVVHFGKTGTQTFRVDYDALPGRGQLIAMMLNPLARPPRAPSAMSVLWRSLLAHQRYDLDLAPNELELRPPHVPGASVVEFSNHRKVYLAGYEWAQSHIEALRAEGDPALGAILAAARLAPDD